MAFAYEVYCYYNVDTLEAVFNGVAMIVNSGGYATLIKTVLTLGVLIMAMVSLGTGKFEGMKWIVVASIFYIAFLGPKANIILVDRITAQPPKVVANIPLGLAFMAHFTSYTGDWMTTTMESAFTVLPDSMTFGAGRVSTNTGETHGLMFGAKLLSETRRAVIGDPNLRMDWYAFIRNCTIYDVAPGGRINIDTLQKSQDIIAALGDTSPARITSLYDPANPALPAQVTCLEAHGYLKARLSLDVANQANVFGRSLNPNISATTSNAAVLAIYNTQASEITQLMLSNSRNAVDTIQQAMAINLMDSSGAVIGQQLNDPSSVQIALAQAQAEASANSSYATMAKVAESAMPKIRNVIEVVVYATFPIVMLIILVAGHRAGAPLKAYFMTLVWLQLWPPLYAILNLVVSMETAKQTIAAAVAQGGGLTIASAADIGAASLSSQAIAGYMVMLIPVIAGAITKGGEQAMSSLASSLTAPTQQAASQAGAQAATGNLSFGNTSLDTHSAHNTSMNNHASSLRMDAGPAAMQMTDRDNNTIGVSASGKTLVAEAKNSFNQTAQASIDQSKTSQRNADIAHSESVKSGTTVGESMGNAYKLMTGSAKERAHGIELLSTAGHTSNAVAGAAFEKMQSVISKDAASVDLDAKDIVQFQAGLKTGLSGADALEGVMASKGVTGNNRAGWLAMMAKNTGASVATTEGVSTALSSKLNHSDETSSADAYKTLNTLQEGAQFGYQVGDKSSAGSKSSEGVNAELSRMQEARRSQEISQGEEKKWGERASREEKIGKLLSQDVLQSANADKELKALGQSIGNKQLAEGGAVAFVGMSDQKRMEIAQQLLQARDEGMSQLGGDLSPNATAALKEGPPAGGNTDAQNTLYANGSAGSKEQFGADSRSAVAAHSPGVTADQLTAVQKAERDIAATKIQDGYMAAGEGQASTNKQQAATQKLVADGVTAPNLYAKTVETAAHSPGMVVAGSGGCKCCGSGLIVDTRQRWWWESSKKHSK